MGCAVVLRLASKCLSIISISRYLISSVLPYHSMIRLLLMHLIPGENRQAVDRLDSCVDRPLVGRDSATSAQPAGRWGSRATINPPNYPHVIGKGHGVDDGFRTRDLRIHNPAL